MNKGKLIGSRYIYNKSTLDGISLIKNRKGIEAGHEVMGKRPLTYICPNWSLCSLEIITTIMFRWLRDSTKRNVSPERKKTAPNLAIQQGAWIAHTLSPLPPPLAPRPFLKDPISSSTLPCTKSTWPAVAWPHSSKSVQLLLSVSLEEIWSKQKHCVCFGQMN